MDKPRINPHPFWDCLRGFLTENFHGADCFQQFNCKHCGVKQTIDNRNVFYTHGECEECKEITNIVEEGSNYLLILPGKHPRDFHFAIAPQASQEREGYAIKAEEIYQEVLSQFS
jgi:hypothetical protein